MSGSKKFEKRPPPSYEEGKLRDPEIEKKQDESFNKATLLKLIRKAARPSKA